MSDTPYKKSMDIWLASESGKDCNDILTLKSSRSQDDLEKFLTNRLKAAFEAGWNGGLARSRYSPDSHIGRDAEIYRLVVVCGQSMAHVGIRYGICRERISQIVCKIGYEKYGPTLTTELNYSHPRGVKELRELSL